MVGNVFYIGGVSAKELTERFGTPLYAYEEENIRKSYRRINNSIPYEPKQIYFAGKANPNGEILRILKEEGSFLYATTVDEVKNALSSGFRNNEIIVSGPNLTNGELQYFVSNGIQLNLGSACQFERYSRINPNSRVGIRIGLNGDVRGVDEDEVEEVKEISQRHGVIVNGTAVYLGTRINDANWFLDGCQRFLDVTSKHFKDVEYIDIGGGFGIPYYPNEKPFDWDVFGSKISRKMEEFPKQKGVSLKLEPGRALVGEAGTYLTRVIDIKKRGNKLLIGVDGSVTSFPRPFMFGSYHPVVHTTKADEEKYLADIHGSSPLSQDFLGRDVWLPKPEEGDVLAFLNSGAYCSSLSFFSANPKECLLNKEGVRLI